MKSERISPSRGANKLLQQDKDKDLAKLFYNC